MSVLDPKYFRGAGDPMATPITELPNMPPQPRRVTHVTVHYDDGTTETIGSWSATLSPYGGFQVDAVAYGTLGNPGAPVAVASTSSGS